MRMRLSEASRNHETYRVMTAVARSKVLVTGGTALMIEEKSAMMK